MPDFIKQIFWSICYYCFLLTFVTGTMVVNLFCILLIPFLPKSKSRNILRSIAYHLFDFYQIIMEMSGAIISNRDVLKKIDAAEGGLLIIANHPSLVDAPIIFSRIRGLICVFKSSLNKSLGIVRTSRAMGHLSNDGGIDMIRNLTDALKDGEKVLLFPEGTRTVSDTIDPFNPGYALAAIRAQVPVQMIRIHSDTPILSKKQSRFSTARFPCGFLLELGPVVEPGQFNRVKSFNEHVESWYKNIPKDARSTPLQFLPSSVDCSSISDTSSISFRVPKDPFYCRGHMPGNPIVPAYAQMAWVRELMEFIYPGNTDQLQYFRWKFLKPVLPGDALTISVRKSGSKNNVMVTKDDDRVSHGIVSLQEDPA